MLPKKRGKGQEIIAVRLVVPHFREVADGNHLLW